jgi:hypothetical protein
MVKRWGYLDTSSSAGRPVEYTLKVSSVYGARKWHNYYGNPSYTLRFTDEAGERHTLYLVDDYGGLNDLRGVDCQYVNRRKDLFAGWL